MTDFKNRCQPTNQKSYLIWSIQALEMWLNDVLEFWKKNGYTRKFCLLWYKTQRCIIYVCCMWHNFIKMEMPLGDIKGEMDNKPTPDIDYSLEVIISSSP